MSSSSTDTSDHQKNKSDVHVKADKPKVGFFEKLGFNKKSSVSEEEIKEFVADTDQLLDDEKRMINEILDLSNMTVNEIMKPRVDMILVEDTETGMAALERMRGTGYTRLPVYHDEMDNIVGILNIKDLIGPLMDGRIEEPVTKFMYDPMFVPETKDVIPLLSQMQEERQQMAIVVDEYGGTDGLITIEDIVEEIVGEIIDETDLDRDLATQISDDVWRVAGRLPVEEAQKLGFPVADSDDYETLAGWLMDFFDSVPNTGDEFIVEGYRFRVEKMRRSRILTIRVERLEEPEAQEEG